MFESKKYEKMKASGEFSEITFFIPLSANKQKLKALLKLLKDDFNNYKCIKTKSVTEIHTMGENLNVEMKLGDVMNLVAEMKQDEPVLFRVNEVDYEI